MSERNHSKRQDGLRAAPAQTAANSGSQLPGDPSGRRRRLTILAAGTAIAVLGGAVLFQVFRSKPASSSELNRPAAAGAAVAEPYARVNGELIGWKQVANECIARYGRDVLENIINRTVIQHACQEHGVVVTKTEVDKEVFRIAQKFNLTVPNWYQMLQKERGLTAVQYRRDIIWPMLALRKIASVKIQIKEEDVIRMFQREYGPRVKAKMIMFGNFRRAGEVQTLARRDPKEFGRLARKYSIDPTSRALDGDIPPIRLHSGNPDLVKKAFALHPGEISAVIQVGIQRWVILFCEGRTKPIVTNIDEVRSLLIEQLREEMIQESVARKFEELKKKARVDNYLTGVTRNPTGSRSSVPGAARTRSGSRAGGQYPARATVGPSSR